MDTRTLKFISIPTILVVNFLIGIFPYFLISKRIKKMNRRQTSSPTDHAKMIFVSSKMKLFLTFANFFCGGVFLSTALIGLYPSVSNKFNDIIRRRSTIPEYPYAGLSLAFGFFFVWILEISVHTCLHGQSHSHEHNHSSMNNQEHNDIQGKANSIKTTSFISRDHEHDHAPSSPTIPDEHALQPLPSDRLLNGEDNNNDDDKTRSPDTKVTIEESHEAHSHVPIKGNLLGSVMLTFALGSHSIIEGLGFAMIGEFSMTLNMLVTVLIHESVCALSLGVNLASKKTPLATSLALLATFSALIPAGIGIGMAVNMGLERNLMGDALTAIFQGIAAGTFIYVVFMEILPSEMLQRRFAFWKFLFMVVGFAVIGVMKYFHPHGPPSQMNCTVYNSSFPQTRSVHRHM